MTTATTTSTVSTSFRIGTILQPSWGGSMMEIIEGRSEGRYGIVLQDALAFERANAAQWKADEIIGRLSDGIWLKISDPSPTPDDDTKEAVAKALDDFKKLVGAKVREVRGDGDIDWCYSGTKDAMDALGIPEEYWAEKARTFRVTFEITATPGDMDEEDEFNFDTYTDFENTMNENLPGGIEVTDTNVEETTEA